MTTLSQLKTSVDAWLARDDVAVSGADFPQILLIAESNIARDLRLVTREAVATLNFTGRSADLPADYIEARNPFIDDNIRRFEYQTPQAIRESSAWNGGLGGGGGGGSLEPNRPGMFYTIEGNAATDAIQMTIAPPASATTPLDVEIRYWARALALVNDPDTNWLLANHFDIYLYATLRAAAEYIQEDVLEDRYQAKYDRAIAAQNLTENRKRYTAAPKQAYGNPRGVI